MYNINAHLNFATVFPDYKELVYSDSNMNFLITSYVASTGKLAFKLCINGKHV